jgi:hypothetical protein
MISQERKANLQKIISETQPCRTGIPIMYHGERKEFDAYRIPLSYLVYNPYNGRIGSAVKSYERQNHPLNPENLTDKAIIEKFLWDSKIDANKITKKRLLKEHQEKHGIVTADGKIIDGNRRAMLLNNIMADETIEFNEKSHCQYFIAIILPDDADKKEILALETTYQMGEDAKVDYNPIEKYLKCGDLQTEGFSVDDIAGFMAIKPSEVKTMLSALKLMDDYLDQYDYSGMYTQLEKNEDSFLKLDSALKKYKGGVASMWDYSPEEDVSDLKLVAFDYIRANFEQTLFRNIINAPSPNNSTPSFFSQKDIWQDFRDRHFDNVDSVKEETVQEIMMRNPPDLGRALRSRDKQWAANVDEGLQQNFTISLDQLNNKAEADKPLQLLIKACQALSVVDVTQDTFSGDPKVKSCVETLSEYVEKFKSILKV